MKFDIVGYLVGFLAATLIAVTVHAYQANHPAPQIIPACREAVLPVESAEVRA